LTESSPVIGRGIQVEDGNPAKGYVVPSLTIGTWLPGIVHGVDLIPLTIRGAESMGEFGDRTEKVGTGPELFATDAPAGIFEFRGAQAQKIPLERWGPFAREFHRYVTLLHSGEG
jgi:hypothetical protein